MFDFTEQTVSFGKNGLIVKLSMLIYLIYLT